MNSMSKKPKLKTNAPVWSYQAIRSGDQLAVCRDNIDKDASYYSGLVDMELYDCTVRINVRVAIVNLFLFTILSANGVEICERHVVKRTHFNNERMTDALNNYYFEILDLGIERSDALKKSIMDMYSEMYEFCCIGIIPYTSSFDIVDIAEILHDDAIQPLMDKKELITPEMGTGAIEKFIASNSKEMMRLIDTPGALKNESLLSYSKVGQMSAAQVPQAFYAFGVRTDVSDMVVGLPVIGSSADGLRDGPEFAVESLTAKKSAFYTYNSVPESQYMNRRWQLLTSTIRHIYPVPCVNNILVPFYIYDYNCIPMIGKYVYHDNKRILITKQNCHDFIDKEVLMESPCTCTYRNGVCLKCGGKLYENFHPAINPGMVSSQTFVQQITQKILSAKHFTQTNSIEYMLPGETSKVMRMVSINEIAWKKEATANLKHLSLGLPLKQFGVIHDVTMLRDYVNREEHFGKMPHVFVKDNRTGDFTKYDIRGEHQVPYASQDLLMHMRNNYDDIIITDQIAWVPLNGTEDMVILRTAIANDNILQFVDQVSSFLESHVKTYTSIPEALHDFSKIAHRKSSCAMVQMETILKAHLVSGPEDYRVPLVTDIYDVMFGTNKSILDHRDIGTKLGYEEIKAMVMQPRTYLVPKQESVYDIFTRPLLK